MPHPPNPDVPADLRALSDAIPDPAAVRERIDRNRAEARFLRRLLKLACDARDARGDAAPSVDAPGGKGVSA